MTTKHCQKCGKEKYRHDLFACRDCKLNCCRSCLDENETIYSPTLCHGCGSARRVRDHEERKRRLGP
jgi:hypothetical protein